jgi:hypothetical protein
MPPSPWSNQTLSGGCLIYNFPIVNSQFPIVTNDPAVVSTLQTTANNRCFWSNELALQKATRKCLKEGCYDDLGNKYDIGQSWSYYAPCGNSCYALGEMLGLIVIGMESPEYPIQAFKFIAYGDAGGGIVSTVVPNIQDMTQYHRLLRYSTSKASITSTNGRYCNIIHVSNGKTNYLTIRRIEFEGDVYYKPSYTDVKPNVALWFMAPPNSVGGTEQSQKLVFIDGFNMGTNPSLNVYASTVQSKSLLAIGYGLNTQIRNPVVDLFMIDAQIPRDLYQFTTNVQFIDISRYDIMINSTTTLFPFYRWSGS